jgi:predicted  nucleic acid-binding Zn-ribbon protein
MYAQTHASVQVDHSPSSGMIRCNYCQSKFYDTVDIRTELSHGCFHCGATSFESLPAQAPAYAPNPRAYPSTGSSHPSSGSSIMPDALQHFGQHSVFDQVAGHRQFRS